MEARRVAHQPAHPFQLSLRIRHPSIDPAEISRELQITPEHSFRAGEPREAGRSVAATAVHAESYWLATLDLAAVTAQNPAFDIHVRSESAPPTLHTAGFGVLDVGVLDAALMLCTLNVLRPHAEFIKRIQAEDGEVRLIVGLSSRKARGFTLTPSVTRVLSDLRVPIDFELTHR